MNAPSLAAIVDLYPWKPSLALHRALEWRGIYQYRDLCLEPILDLGCGDGAIHALFFGKSNSVGIDVDHTVVLRAKHLMGKVVRGDARWLPFKAGVFGSIIGICVAEHLPEVDACLTEVCRVLRPGGVLIATVPSAHWKPLYFWNRFFTALGCPRLGRKIVDVHDQKMVHLNLLSPDEWTRRLVQIGLEPFAYVPFLAPRTASFVTFLESIYELPFPFPGFWTNSGAFYFATGILRRVGGVRFWKRVFSRAIAPFYQEAIGPGGIAGGTMFVARKLTA